MAVSNSHCKSQGLNSETVICSLQLDFFNSYTCTVNVSKMSSENKRPGYEKKKCFVRKRMTLEQQV